MTPQTAFRAALLDAAQPVPDGLTDGAGRPAGRRYAVYRNNVAVSLHEALATGFPVIEKLIGAENFRTVAGIYLRAEPPASPMLMHYGVGFPDFLARCAPLQKIAYLGDVARLELALRRSYHAADSSPADPALLQTLGEDALMSATFTLAPAVQIVRSAWPILDLWTYNTQAGAAKPTAGGQDVVILRPDFDPAPHLLPRGGADFLDTLATGAPFATALSAAGDDFDLSATLSLLLAHGALTGIHI